MAQANGRVFSSHTWATGNVTLGCYPGAIDGKTRFATTLFFLLLPFTLYFFELLRFRVLSSSLERRFGTTNCIVMYVIKPLGNALLWITWPVVAFFRLFWYRYRYEASEGEGNIHRHRRATLIGSRAQLIEVCTESSLQPLFQFYLVFQVSVILNCSCSSAAAAYYGSCYFLALS